VGVSLGGIYLDGFEVAARIQFGGRQALAVHKLPGGARIIDAMGPDDDAIGWHGILTGGDATGRARALDAMRVDGLTVALSWDVFAASVIISDLKLSYCNSWWIPYQIVCTVVVGTQAIDSLAPGGGILAAVITDLTLAGQAPGVGAAFSAVNSASAISVGSPGYATASTALATADQAISQALANSDAAMQSATDVPTLVSTAGSLASLSAAAGYVGRAATNFTAAGL
jgi:hypothetical protein